MAHKNYGGINHINTGYNQHSNTGYNNHSNNGAYNNHYNGGYNNHSNTGYNNWVNTGCKTHADYWNRIVVSKKRNVRTTFSYEEHIPTPFYGGDYSDYTRHTNTGYSNHTNGGYNNWANNGGYNNWANTGHNNHANSGYNNWSNNGAYSNHGNSGYTNHVNTTTNVAPGNVANVSRGSSAYYKSTISLSWTAAADNNKVISVVSRNTGSGGHADNGIWENTVQKRSAARSWCAAAWDSNGSYVGSIASDVYGNAANATTFINWLNANATSGRYVAILGFDEPYTNASAIINTLKGWGFSSLSAADTTHFVFTGIAHMGVGIKAQQTVRRYGTSDVRVASSSYTIPGVASSQTITYYIDYAFKPIGGSYGAWTRIVNGHTTNSYNYSLASHGNGHIKFRVLSSDGVENGSTWVESSEVRVLKYDAPAFSTTTSGNTIDDADGELVRVEINKLCVATGQAQATTAITPAKVMTKTEITDLRNKIKSVGTAISKTNITDTNLDIIRPADLQNIKNWIKTV